MQCKVGTFISAGLDYDIPIGFVPDYLLIINENAVSPEVGRIEWFGTDQGVLNELQTLVIDEDGAGTQESQLAITDDASGHINAIVEISTPVITASNQSVEGQIGITLDAAFHSDSDVIRYVAMRSDHTEDHGDVA
jgi:hypothetical protein